MQKHFSLIFKADIISHAILIATNSEPYVLDSQVFCHLLKTIVGVLLSKMNMLVSDCCVTWFPAWSESTKHDISKGLPNGTGLFGGSSSVTLP
jgi:hypothetical protein